MPRETRKKAGYETIHAQVPIALANAIRQIAISEGKQSNEVAGEFIMAGRPGMAQRMREATQRMIGSWDVPYRGETKQ